jgi:hypothetical protein
MSETQHNTTPKKPPRWVKGFLSALAETGIVRAACDAVGIERSTAYDLRNTDEAFAANWDDALENAADLLEQEARRRAHQGVQRVKFDRGKPIMVPVLSASGLVLRNDKGDPEMVPYIEHEYSDSLMMFLLKAARPEKYRERSETKHTFEPIDWDTVPSDVRDAFIDGRIKLEDVYRLVSRTK